MTGLLWTRRGGPCHRPCVLRGRQHLQVPRQAYTCTQRCPAQHKGTVTRAQPLPQFPCTWGRQGLSPPAQRAPCIFSGMSSPTLLLVPLSQTQTWPPGRPKLLQPSPTNPVASPSHSELPRQGSQTSPSQVRGVRRRSHWLSSLTNSRARSVLDSFFKIQDVPREAEAAGKRLPGWLPALGPGR